MLAAENPPVPAAASGADAYRLLLAYDALGGHRSGTPGDEATQRWLVQQLTGFGLQPRVEPFDFQQFDPGRASLTLADGRAIRVLPYWYSGRTDDKGLRAPLADVGRGSQAEFDAARVGGKLVLAQIDLQYRALYPNLADVMRRAAAAGAVGVVAAVQGPGNLIVAANAESEAGLCGLPVLLVGARDGQRLRHQNGRSLHFTLDARLRRGQSANVVARIAGRSDDTLIIGTPFNGWFGAAAERGAGVGTLLTLARDYASRSEPPEKTLVFVFSGGHEVGYLGLQHFIDEHADWVDQALAYVHLGAGIGAHYQFLAGDGAAVTAPIADPARTLYVSENPLLQKLVSARQLLSGLMPAQSVLPSVNNPGEQRRMYARGVPIVSISGTTLYFHTAADTPDTTSAAMLEAPVKFYGSVIKDLLAASTRELRAANTTARDAARPLPTPVCVVPPVAAPADAAMQQR